MEKQRTFPLPKDSKTLLKLGAVFAAGLLLIFAGNAFAARPAGTQTEAAPQAEDNLEQRLTHILARVKGVGEVEVCLLYDSLYSREYAYNENTSARRQQESAEGRSVVSSDSSSNKTYFTAGTQNQPLLVKEYAPRPQSVLIVAEGAGAAEVREQLFSVAQSLLGLPANKISIVQMR